uniref:Uncharacterized protein n=1 Tax=Anopheles arabiensis TaxID=7173 RepID=A0A182IG06_ANOAR
MSKCSGVLGCRYVVCFLVLLVAPRREGMVNWHFWSVCGISYFRWSE